MIESRNDQLFHMVVGERVVDVLAFAAARDEMLGAQQAKSMGHCRKLVAGRERELADALLAAARQALQQAQTARVPDRFQKSGRSLDHREGRQRQRRRGFVIAASLFLSHRVLT